MAHKDFLFYSQTFGLEKPNPWSLHALRLIMSAPRIYQPLVDSFDLLHPGSKKALYRLVREGWVDKQTPVIYNTQTSTPATQATKAVKRYILSSKGRKLLEQARDDTRILEDQWSRVSTTNLDGLLSLLNTLDLDLSSKPLGISKSAATTNADLAPSTALWWFDKLSAEGYIKTLPIKLADTRALIPTHYRPKKILADQLSKVFEAYPKHAAIAATMRLSRTSFLSDITLSRVGISGITDYDHDVNAQTILAKFVTSPSFSDTVFSIEPRYALPVTSSGQFTPGSGYTVIYTPDAQFRRIVNGKVRHCVLEYERYQTRKDGWAHISRFMGHMYSNVLATYPAELIFIVDSYTREKTYAELIAAYADWIHHHPERMPARPILLKVSSIPRINSVPDPLADSAYHTVLLKPSTGTPLWTEKGLTGYTDYF